MPFDRKLYCKEYHRRRRQNHPKLASLGNLLVAISKEKNRRDFEKSFCPVCGRDFDQ
jgi:hypothetical protein